MHRASNHSLSRKVPAQILSRFMTSYSTKCTLNTHIAHLKERKKEKHGKKQPIRTYQQVSRRHQSSHRSQAPPHHVFPSPHWDDGHFLPVRASALPVQAPPLPESLCSAVWQKAHQGRGLCGSRSQKTNRDHGLTPPGPPVGPPTGWVHQCQRKSRRMMQQQCKRRQLQSERYVALCSCPMWARLAFLLVPVCWNE